MHDFKWHFNGDKKATLKFPFMRYAISYVSTAAQNLPQENIYALLEKASAYNNNHDITGILLSSDGNFFQLLEGDEVKIKELYSRIEKDPRHTNIIKFLEKPVTRPSYDGYICEVITGNTKCNGSKLEGYLHYIEVLDRCSQEAVKRVMEAFVK